MSDPSSRNPIGGSQKRGDSPVKDDLNELRRLLLAREHEQLGKLQERLDDPELFAGEISSVLPEAILLRLTEDRRLTTVLTPAVEHILKTSVERDPSTLVNALFPVIGPAIRKAIAETFKKMMQSLNQTLERSFSWQGLKWRMEARRTGKSIAEVVILHSLLYRVEQVFLIHRHTGLVLQQVVADSAVSPDADMVSSMLTAIQDFAHDSFKLQSGEVLETLQVGELSVWIEQGPQALLAAVIRGNAPEDLRSRLTESLEFIHLEQGAALEHFEGDTMPLEASRPRLEACLKAQYKTRRRKLSPFLWLALVALFILVGVSVFFPFRNYLRWKEYLGKLNGEKGIVVTEVAKRDGKYFIYGLLDPLAADPQVLLQKTMLDPEKVVLSWEMYQALNPEFVLERSKRILDPPSTVSLKMEGNTLMVEGSAPHQWILRTRELVRVIPGIMYLQENDLVDRELVEISSTEEHIENQVLHFEEGSSELGPNQRAQLETLFGEIQKLKNLVQMVGANLHIQIVGHTDKSGPEEWNSILSQQRADNIRALLISKGISPRHLSAAGVGANEPLTEKRSEQNSGFNRRVSFQVAVTDAFSGY